MECLQRQCVCPARVAETSAWCYCTYFNVINLINITEKYTPSVWDKYNIKLYGGISLPPTHTYTPRIFL